MAKHPAETSSHMRSFDLTQRLERHSEEPVESALEPMPSSGTRLSSARFPSTSIDGASQEALPPRSQTPALGASHVSGSQAGVSPHGSHTSTADGMHAAGQLAGSEWLHGGEGARRFEPGSPADVALQRSMHAASPESSAAGAASQEGSRGNARSPKHVRTVVTAPHGTGVVTVFRAQHRQGSSPQDGTLSPGPMHWRSNSRGSSRGAGGPLGEAFVPEAVANVLTHASVNGSGRGDGGGGGWDGSADAQRRQSSRWHGRAAAGPDPVPRVVTAPEAESVPETLPRRSALHAYRGPLETLLEGSSEPLPLAAAAAAIAAASASAADGTTHTSSVFELTSFGFSSTSLSPTASADLSHDRSLDGPQNEFSFHQSRAERRWASDAGAPQRAQHAQHSQRAPQGDSLAATLGASLATRHGSAAAMWDSLRSLNAGSPHPTDDPSASLAHLGHSSSRISSADLQEGTGLRPRSAPDAHPIQPHAAATDLQQSLRRPLHLRPAGPASTSQESVVLQPPAVTRTASLHDELSPQESRVSSSDDAQLPMPPPEVQWYPSGSLSQHSQHSQHSQYSRPTSSASTSPTKTPGARIGTHAAAAQPPLTFPAPRGPPGAKAAASAALLQAAPLAASRLGGDTYSSSDGMAAGPTATYDGSSDRSPLDAGSIVLPPPPLFMPWVRCPLLFCLSSCAGPTCACFLLTSIKLTQPLALASIRASRAYHGPPLNAAYRAGNSVQFGACGQRHLIHLQASDTFPLLHSKNVARGGATR